MRVSAKICDGDWLQHSGADCPVPLLSLVEIKHRAGSTAVAVAGTLTWEHGRFIPDTGCTAPEADIVAYRRVNVTKLNAALAALTPTSGERMLREILRNDNQWVCAGIPDDAIEAGIAAWRAADVAMQDREESEHPEDMADWDEGMIVAAIFKAVGLAALNEGAE